MMRRALLPRGIEIPFFRVGEDVAFGTTAAVLMLLLDAATCG